MVQTWHSFSQKEKTHNKKNNTVKKNKKKEQR